MVQEEHGFTISKTEIYSKEEESVPLVEWSSTQPLVKAKGSLISMGRDRFLRLKISDHLRFRESREGLVLQNKKRIVNTLRTMKEWKPDGC